MHGKMEALKKTASFTDIGEVTLWSGMLAIKKEMKRRQPTSNRSMARETMIIAKYKNFHSKHTHKIVRY